LHVGAFKYSLPTMHKSLLHIHRQFAEEARHFSESFMVSVAISKLGKADLNQELKQTVPIILSFTQTRITARHFIDR